MGGGAWIVVAAAVGAITGFAGGSVERVARLRSELIAAAAAWLAATEALAVAAQQSASMEVGPTTGLGHALEWLADQIEATIGHGRAETMRSLLHRPLMRRYEALSDRAWEATTRLVLLAPARLLRRLEPHLETFEAWMRQPADEELRGRWEAEARPEIVRALRQATRPFAHRLAWRR